LPAGAGSLDGRVAIVTGAAKGMGAEICLALAREGAHLALAAREVAPLGKLSGEIEKLGRRALVEGSFLQCLGGGANAGRSWRRVAGGAARTAGAPPAFRRASSASWRGSSSTVASTLGRCR